MTFTHKLARRLAVLRALPPHCAMLLALALTVACSAGVPTGVDTALNPADAPVVVNPRSLILEANQVSVFKAYAQGVPGDSLVTSIEWTATGGNISLNGTYSSPSTGDFKVVGKRHGPNRTTSDTATVTVVPPQPTITAVVISPDPATVTEKTQQTFGAVGKLSDGSTVAIGVTWTATGGSIDAGGVYTAGTTSGTYRVIAQAASANVADTVPVTVTAPTSGGSSSPSVLYPNLPTGLSQLFQYDGNSLPSSFSGSGMTLGVGSNFTWAKAPAFPTLASTPIDGPTVYDMLYPAGLQPGTTPAGLWMWRDNTFQQQTEYYEAGWFTLPGADFEGPGGSGEWKILGYWAVGQGWPNGYDAQIYSVATPATSTGTTSAGIVASSWSLSIRAQQQVSWAAYPNSGSLNIQCGKWYRYEIHMMLENPVGAANGVLEVWLTNVTDGGSPVKILSYSNRTYRNASNPAGFWKRSFVPVWGGNGPAPKTRDDHLQIARMAAWGR